MNKDKKFQVYAQVRATRQLAGDVANELQKADYTSDEWRQWSAIEDKLDQLESQLERMVAKHE